MKDQANRKFTVWRISSSAQWFLFRHRDVNEAIREGKTEFGKVQITVRPATEDEIHYYTVTLQRSLGDG